MINHEPQDNSCFDRPKARCNPINDRDDTPTPTRLRMQLGDHPYYEVNMKQRFKQGLEKIVEVGKEIGKFVKKNGKKLVISFALPVIFANSVNEGGIYIQCKSGVSTPVLYIKHITGATENYDTAYDAVFLEAPSPTLYIYSKILSSPPEDRLMKDARPPESMTTINSEIAGIGLLSQINAEIDNLIFYPSGKDNFYWKNIIGELSQRVDDGKGSYNYALIGNYDIKNLVNSARTLPISVENGITQGDVFFPSHKLDYSFFHYCDFNRDRRIDGLDFDIFADNFNRNNETDPNTFGSYVGSDVNDVNAYADINRSGGVDFDDLDIFKTYFRFPGDINHDGRGDGKVNLEDFAYLAGDWGARDVNSVADISGPNSVPDRNVDYWDLGAFSEDYLRDINEPGTW